MLDSIAPDAESPKKLAKMKHAAAGALAGSGRLADGVHNRSDERPKKHHDEPQYLVVPANKFFVAAAHEVGELDSPKDDEARPTTIAAITHPILAIMPEAGTNRNKIAIRP